MQNLNQLFFKSSTFQTADVVRLHGDLVTLFKRPYSNQWQCRFKFPNGSWHSMSTGRANLGEAKQSAVAIYERSMAKIAQELSLKSKTFKQLALEELESLTTAVKEGKGKSVYRDYSFVINKYFLPFFGSYCLTDITPQIVRDFESWRDSQMGRHPMASTKRTHSAAYNRIVERARNQALIPKDLAISLLDIQGAPGEARPAFSESEIATLLAFMPNWEQTGHRGRTRSIRQLCRSYVEFLLFTGVRTGTETMPLRWKHLQWHYIGSQRYLKIWVSGKTGPRYLIAKCSDIASADKRRLTTEDFIEAAWPTHGDRYDYSRVNYVAAQEKVEIICSEHGSFWQLPINHSRGSGCPGCAVSGFDQTKPATLYYLAVLTDSNETLYKIGITNLSVHKRFPSIDLERIRTLKTWQFDQGADAAQEELRILREFEDDQYLGPDVLVGAGNTELFVRDVLGLENEVGLKYFRQWSQESFDLEDL